MHAVAKMQTPPDIGARCTREGRPEEIETRVLATLEPEVEKIGKVRDKEPHAYLRDELAPSLAKAFASTIGYPHQATRCRPSRRPHEGVDFRAVVQYGVWQLRTRSLIDQKLTGSFRGCLRPTSDSRQRLPHRYRWSPPSR